MPEPTTWDTPRAVDASHVEPTHDPSKLPLLCMIVAIVDLSMGGFTLLGAPMSIMGFMMMPDDAPLQRFLIPSLLVPLLVGSAALLADIAMLRKKPAAVTLGYVNIAATLIGVVYLWVLLPATLESQKAQMANTPGMTMSPQMENMMLVGVVAGNIVTTLVRLTLVVFVFLAIRKFKAWLSTPAQPA